MAFWLNVLRNTPVKAADTVLARLTSWIARATLIDDPDLLIS